MSSISRFKELLKHGAGFTNIQQQAKLKRHSGDMKTRLLQGRLQCFLVNFDPVTKFLTPVEPDNPNVFLDRHEFCTDPHSASNCLFNDVQM